MKVNLKSSNDQTFSCEKVVAERSLLLKNMLEDIGESEAAIPLPNVSGRVLKKVLEYCTYHKVNMCFISYENDPLPTADEEKEIFEQKKKSETIDDWDVEFIKVDNDLLFEIILAANYLDIKSLLDLGCKTVARMLTGKTPEDIRNLFGIENDFTPEEEDQIRKENEWAVDS